MDAYLLNTIGITDDDCRASLMDAGFEEMEDMVDVDLSTWTHSVCQIVRKNGAGAPANSISKVQEKRMDALVHWVRIMFLTQRGFVFNRATLGATSFVYNWFKGHATEPDDKTPVYKESLDKREWMESIQQYLKYHKGEWSKVPLAYVIRPEG